MASANRRREAQASRATRLALNAVHRALDTWKAAVGEGKSHATELTNTALRTVHLPALPLGALEGTPGLLAAAIARLAQRQREQLAALAACLDALQGAAGSMAVAAASLEELMQREAEAPVLGAGPVFAGLPLALVAHMLREVHAMHEAELAVKRAVVRGFEQQAAGDPDTAPRIGQARHIGSSGGGGGRERMRPATATDEEERLRRRLQVYLSAWLLSPEVDGARVDTHLAALDEDMKGF
eukprot:scaffold20.g7678.t1